MSLINKLLHPIDLRRDVRAHITEMFHYLPQRAIIYDIGCGNKPFAKILKELGCEYIGVDIDGGFYGDDMVDLAGSAYSVPITDNTADAVLSVQVIEHLERPREALNEAYRILKSNGVMFISFPFLYPIHAPPYDYMRYTHFFFIRAAEEVGFEILEQQEMSGYWYVTGMNVGLYLQAFDRGLLQRIGIIRLFIATAQWVCRGLHRLEGGLFAIMNRNVNGFRQAWTANYVFVLKKTEDRL